jgi:hypothetical protein
MDLQYFLETLNSRDSLMIIIVVLTSYIIAFQRALLTNDESCKRVLKKRQKEAKKITIKRRYHKMNRAKNEGEDEDEDKREVLPKVIYLIMLLRRFH